MGGGLPIAEVAEPPSGLGNRARSLANDIVHSPIAISLGAAALLELLWGLGAGVRLTFGASLALQVIVPGLVALVLLLSGRLRPIGLIFGCLFVWTLLAVIGAPLTYLAARTDLPLADGLLRAFDLALGFDGLKWQAAVHARPLLSGVLDLAYGSLGLQVLFGCILFPLTGETWRFREMFWLAWLGLIATCAISALMPAAGISARYLHYAPAWREHLISLRTGRPILAELGGMRGIVFFPSYHAELALIFSYVNRRAGVVTWALWALNALMLVSTLSAGDHYLADVIAGVALMSGLILLLRRLDLARAPDRAVADRADREKAEHHHHPGG